MKRSKRYKDELKKIDFNKQYNVADAIKLVKEVSNTKFDSTIDVALKLGIDTKKSDQLIRGTVNLPNGTGKSVRVIVFAEGDNATKSKDAGADEVGSDELIEKIKKGFLDFDVAVATPDLMRKIAPIARILGPKGLMPNPKTGTVTTTPEKTVKESKGGRIEFRVDKDANLHFIIGKSSFDENALNENLKTALEEINRQRPQTIKGKFILGASISSTMSPSIKLDL
jgi:large subunit ribosomal protein L1